MQRRWKAVCAAALSAVAIGGFAAYAIAGEGDNVSGPAPTVNVDAGAAVVAVNRGIGGDVNIDSMELVGTSAVADYFIGDGKRPGTECLVIARKDGDAVVGCETPNVITSEGTYLASVAADGASSGAALFGPGVVRASVAGVPTEVLGGRVVLFTSRGATEIEAVTGQGPIVLEVPDFTKASDAFGE